jgi:bacterioferritin-associated ferredoxin
MIVCHCKAVSDRSIRDAVRRGARSPREVVLACQAGRHCGGCMPLVRELIESETADLGPDAVEAPVVAAG